MGTLGASGALHAPQKVDLTNFTYKVSPRSAFGDARSAQISKANTLLDRNSAPRFASALAAPATDEKVKPVFTLGPANLTGDLDAPNGERWFYTGSLTYDEIPPHDNVEFTDYILREYRFDIYDASMKHVGYIQDKMSYRAGEIRVVNCEIAPVITRNFFNTDNNIEVVIGLAVNMDQGNNQYRSLVYSLGDPTTGGYNKPCQTYETLIGDVIEGPATADGRDNFYMSFLYDYTPDDSEITDGDTSYWDFLCSMRVDFDIYGRAEDASGPRKLLTKQIPLVRLPGDQQNSPFMMSLLKGNDVYFVISYLEESFFNPYYSPVEDMTMRANNKLYVEFYKADGNGVKADYTTVIPFTKDSDEETLASYYSIGGMRYTGDVVFDQYGATGARAALIITKDNYKVGSDDSYISSYYVYNADGSRIKTIFENSESMVALSDIPGQEPQQIFVTKDAYGYNFSFVDLISCKEVLALTNQYDMGDDEEPEALTANFDRCAVGTTYKYANELRIPTVDEYDNTYMRILWMDRQGKFDHIDEVNMGKDVMYAQAYIARDVLVPTAYHSDRHQEYMVLIKRGVAGGSNREDLLIGQALNEDAPEGKDILLLSPDQRGILNGIVPDITSSRPNLTVTYNDQSTGAFAMDIYDLPLDGGHSGVAPVIPDSAPVTIDGTTLLADGSVRVYNVAGVMVATGENTVDISGLSAGIYIVNVNGAAHKMLIK